MSDLPFDFTAGRCQGLSQSAVLCSPDQEETKCWELTGSGFTGSDTDSDSSMSENLGYGFGLRLDRTSVLVFEIVLHWSNLVQPVATTQLMTQMMDIILGVLELLMIRLIFSVSMIA